jgi:voltage-gated potassium channel
MYLYRMQKVYIIALIIVGFTCIFTCFDNSHFNYNGNMQSETDFMDRIIDRLYFTTITSSTIGYGDITPRTNITKILTLIMVFIMISTLFY